MADNEVKQTEVKQNPKEDSNGKDVITPKTSIVPHPSTSGDQQEFYLPVHGFVWFYPEEVEIINHPAFQRLDGLHQLGLAHLIYRGATHRRIEHALGTVHVAQRMIEAVTDNSKKTSRGKADDKDQWLIGHAPTDVEIRIVRLAALLHDIGHVPFGHTFEDELHLLNKHDEEARIDKIFAKETWYATKITPLATLIDSLYEQYVPATILTEQSPSQLIKRVLLKPSSESDTKALSTLEQRFGAAGFRTAICRDIVGNTICADLLDYLHRDWYHIGKERHFADRIFHYMEVRTPRSNASISLNDLPLPTSEDVFLVSVGNRPKLRTDGVSAILDLLESRYQLAEAVLFHRTKMTATAMLERAISLAIPPIDKERASGDVAKEARSASFLEDWLIDNPEEVIMTSLLDGKGLIPDASKLSPEDKAKWRRIRLIASKIMRRDLYDQLMLVSYEEFEGRDAEDIQSTYGNSPEAGLNRASALGMLESDFGLPQGSIAMYCPEAKMNSKIAQVRLFVEGRVDQFDDYEDKHNNELSAGHLSAQLLRFKRLWKIGFYVDPAIAEKGEDFLAQLRQAIRVMVLRQYPRGEDPNVLTALIASNVVRIPTFHLFNHDTVPAGSIMEVAREDENSITELYPTKTRRLTSFIKP